MHYKNQAKAYVEALGLNAVDIKEIVEWADSIISAQENPLCEFIKLSLSKSKEDVVTYLNVLSLDAEDNIVITILFGHLYSSLKNKSSNYSEVAKRLYFWVMYETNVSKYEHVAWFWDAIDLADNGTIGNPKIVREEFLQYLYDNKA